MVPETVKFAMLTASRTLSSGGITPFACTGIYRVGRHFFVIPEDHCCCTPFENILVRNTPPLHYYRLTLGVVNTIFILAPARGAWQERPLPGAVVVR